MGGVYGGWGCSAHVPVMQLVDMAAEDSAEEDSVYGLPECKKPKPCEEDVSVSNGASGEWYEKRCKVMKELEASLPPGLSKNQRKKQLRLMYRDVMKDSWRKQKKEKEKEKKRKRRLERDDSQQIVTAVAGPKLTKLMSSESASSVRVAVELGYDHLMSDQDIKMLMKQCQRCYSANRRAEKPLQLYFTGFKGKCKRRLDDYIQGYRHWDVYFREESFMGEFKKEDIVFLTADSPNVLNDLEPSKVYVIGGLVDHNHHKGHCYQQALDTGVEHAQLPITNFLKLNSRKVLAVNHVFEVLLSFEQHKNWEKAFFDVVPARKVTGHAIQGMKEEEDKTRTCMDRPQTLLQKSTASLSVRDNS